MIRIKFSGYLFTILSVLFFCCTGTIKKSSIPYIDPNDWVLNHPLSDTDFVGVGCEEISGNMDDAQRSARNKALEEISSQIKVRVEGNTVVEETQKTVNDNTYDSSIFNERIKTYTESIFEGVKISETKITSDYYCVKMTLNKIEYYTKLNEKINRAKAIAIDGLIAAEKTDPVNKVYELLTSLESINGFTASLLSCRINGQDIILNTEIVRRLRQTLDDIRLKPTISDLAIGALDSLPDTIGFYVTYQNVPIDDCPLIWSASNIGVTLLTQNQREKGFYPTRVSDLRGSFGKITISVAIDFSKIRDALEKQGFRLPIASFVLSRNKPSVYPTVKGEFVESLVNELLNSNTFSMASSAETADYTIKGAFTFDPKVTILRSIFQASGMVECTLNMHGTKPVVEIRRNITTGSGKSENAAVQSLKKEAVGVAMKEINRIF